MRNQLKIKEFKGGFFEIGKQQGEIYKKQGMSFPEIKDKELYQKQLAIYKKYYPELLEEFKGMAEAGGFDFDKLANYFICTEIEYFRKEFSGNKECTIFGVKNKNGVFVGRNYDWDPETEKIFEVYKIKNTQRNHFIAVTDMGIDIPADIKSKNLYYNADDAINDKGLFIGLTFAYCADWTYGISCIFITKLIAETCSTVKEALDVFKKVPLCCPKNFFIADKNGDMAVVEHTSKEYKILYPKNDILIQTNHYVDEYLAKKDIVLKKIPYHNTFIRYYETLQGINFNKKGFQQKNIIHVLGRKGSYTLQDFPGVKTIWTLALDMKKQNHKIYWDHFGKRKEQELKI